jgi:hypothetical protein
MATRTASGISVAKGAKAAAEEAVTAAAKRLGGTPHFGVVFGSPDHDLGAVLSAAQAKLPKTTLIGCTTAGELTEEGLVHGGVSVMLIESSDTYVQPALAGGLKSDPARAANAIVAAHAKGKPVAQQRGLSHSLSVTLVDGLAGTGEQLIDAMRSQLGALHDIVGGAAGDEGRFKGTSVGTGEARSDAAAALHIWSSSAWSVGVDHGLAPATKTLRVTRAKDNVVFELDGRPAFDVYRDFAKERGVELTPGNAGSFLINHELGVFVFDKMRKARAPLSVGADGSLSCAATIPQGASVAILDGERGALTAAAQSAAAEARERLGGREPAGVLLFDCICRGTILAEDFKKEIEAIRTVFPKVPIAGFLTYGEIARYSGRLDGWHNTTAVVVAIPR